MVDIARDQDPTFLVGTPPSQDGGDPENRPLPRGTNVDGYVLLEVLGQGGMGTVYAAYDPDLDRKVALKLLRTDRMGPEAVADGHQRLLREARALAKLSHPNVVALYDAGTFEGDVYLAMEMAEGDTLKTWLRRAPRTTAEILKVFAEAGRGLAAAHDAGLVHRDFKPSNVLVSSDGRVRVLDFGLARVVATIDDTEDHEDHLDAAVEELRLTAGEGSLDPRDDSLTRTGALLGTPVYMAPEAMSGRFDHRCDQFSFCVALYEALHGVRPFRGRTTEVLRQSIQKGNFVEPTGDRTAPAWVRRLLRRGLRSRPQDRWPTMHELLRQLERHALIRRRRWLGAAAVLTLSAGTTLGVAAAENRAALCTGGEDQVADVWNDTRRGQIQRAFDALDAPYADDAAQRVTKLLDVYAQDWSAMHQEACEATRVRGEQTPQMLDLRMTCLDHNLRQFRALTTVLTQANEDLAQRAVEAASSLPSMDNCADLAALQTRVAPPKDDQQKALVAELRDRRATMEALLLAGRFDEAYELAPPLMKDAEAADYPPVLAEAQYSVGNLQVRRGKLEEAENLLENAAFTATASRHDFVIKKAQVRLVHLVGYELARKEEALLWDRHARASIAGLGADDDLRGDLENATGAVHGRVDEWAVAEKHFFAALEAKTRAHGADHVSLAPIHANLAVALARQDRYEEAIEHGKRSLELREQTLGPDHPDVALALTNLASAESGAFRLEDARAHITRAIESFEKTLDKNHPTLASAYGNFGNILRRLGDQEAALKHFQRTLAIREATLATDHLSIARGLLDVAGVLTVLKRLDEAETMLRRALDIAKAKVGDEHSGYGVILAQLGRVENARGDLRRAEHTTRQALEIVENELGPKHSKVGIILNQLGHILVESGRHADAVPVFERALKTDGFNPSGVGSASLGLAKALALTDPARARAAAEKALEVYDEQGPGYAKQRDEVEQWIRDTLGESASGRVP